MLYLLRFVIRQMLKSFIGHGIHVAARTFVKFVKGI